MIRKRSINPVDGLSRLHAIVCASHLSAGHLRSGRLFGDVREMLGHVLHDDIGDVLATPWLGRPCPEPMLSSEETLAAVDQWKSGGCRLLGVKARAITAKRFNEFCELGLNKADLLSQSTLRLVRQTIESSSEAEIRVYCDRHGGRRYYAGVIQHVFDDGHVQVVSESKAESVYQCQWRGKLIRLAFTVKGDRFAPVAMASLHAKYIRERLMESFNAYFAEHHRGRSRLKPTAGYPLDANRFLDETTVLRKRLGIPDHDLIRVR